MGGITDLGAMKILLTGSTGLIGSEFLRQARFDLNEVVCLGHILTDVAALKALDWSGVEGVVHLAAAGVKRVSPTRSWADCMAVNFAGTRDLLESLLASGQAPRVFVAGSIREAETFVRPDYWRDPYIASKKFEGLYVREWAKRYKGRVLRPLMLRCGDAAEVWAAAHRILCYLKQ